MAIVASSSAAAAVEGANSAAAQQTERAVQSKSMHTSGQRADEAWAALQHMVVWIYDQAPAVTMSTVYKS